MLSKLAIVRVKLDAFQSTIAAQQGKDTNRLTMHSVEQFNGILRDLKTQFPDIASDLPAEFKVKSDFNMVGSTDISPLDLQIAIRQILGLIGLLETDSK